MNRYYFRTPYRKRRRKSKKFNLFLVYILFVVLLIYCFTLFEIKLRPIIESVAEAKAKSIAVTAINEAVSKKMRDANIKYDDLVILQRGSQDQVTALSANVIMINQLKSDIASEITGKISDVNELRAYIPLGALLNQGLFSGAGPKIPIRLVPLGYSKVDITNNFTDAGINQTKHEIHLEVSAAFNVLLPFSRTTAEVTTNLPIAETVILGIVPDTYTNIEGVTEAPPDILLDTLP